jgi:DNA-binding response OmpR family regulator
MITQVRNTTGLLRNYTMQTVMIVEDDAELFRLYQTVFSDKALMQATTVRQAIEYLQNIIPEIVVLDMSLPDGNGFTILKFLRENPRFAKTQILVVTGNDQYQERVESMGVEYFLFKPISVMMLKDLVARLYQAKSMR